MKTVLATRGSKLALWQAHTTRDLLGEAFPDREVVLERIQSSGDIEQKLSLERFGRIGIFTAEVDAALLEGRAQIAVHSLKDMTTVLQDGLVLAGVLARGPVEDVLITRDGRGLDDLDAGARIATGSQRRVAMIRRLRKDLEPVGIRGNVETRLRKLDEGEADALVMARAGFVRLGYEDRISEVIGIDRMLPAVGQGIVGLTCRAEDTSTRDMLTRITDRPAWYAALCERAFLRALHGGCNVPAACHARVDGEGIKVEARVLSLDGSEEIRAEDTGGTAEAEALGLRLAESMIAQGADRLVEASRS